MFGGLVLSIAGVLFIFFVIQKERTWEIFEKMHPGFLLMALSFVFAVWIVEGLRIQIILNLLKAPVKLSEVVEINIVSNFVAAITPASTGGPPAQTYLLYRRGVPMDVSLTVVTVRLLLTFAFFSILVPFLLILYRNMLEFTFFLNFMFTTAVVAIILLIGLSFYLIFKPQLVKKVVLLCMKSFPLNRWVKNAEQISEVIYTKARDFNHTLLVLWSTPRRERLLGLVVLTLAHWILFFAIAPALFLGLGVKPALLSVLVRQVIFYFGIAYVPLPGGSGVAELGLAGLFGPLVPSYLLAGFVGGWRFLTYHINIIFGGLLALRMAKKGLI